MERDIGANNYPFQCFLCFLTLKLHPSFLLTTINHKSCTLSHNFSHNRKIYLIRKLLTKFCFKTRFYTQTLVKWSWNSHVSHTDSLLFYHIWRATENHQINKNSSFFFNFNFQSICPHQIFLLALAAILTHRNL